ncbi:MAG: UTRA domain-containing protein [Stackebrandtia sp.]
MAGPRLAGELGVSADDPLWRIERVFAVDGAPAVLMRDFAATVYGDTAIRPEDLSDIDTNMIDLIREQTGIAMTRTTGSLAAVVADATAARLLDVAEGQPLVHIRQQCLTSAGTPVLYTSVYYHTDVVTLSINRTVRR